MAAGSVYSTSPLLSYGSGSTGCNTWTFQVKLQNNSQKALSHVTALRDQGFIFTLNDITGAKGIVGKIAADGQLAWTKELSQFQTAITVKKVKFFSNDLLYVIGDATSQVSNITQPFIAVMDTLGNVQWMKQVSVSGIGGSWQGVELDQWENSFVLLISNDSLINISRLQLNGSLIWSKSFKPKNKPQCVGVLTAERESYIAYNETDAGIRKCVVQHVDLNGNLKQAWKLGDNGTGYIMQTMRTINLRPRITALCIRNGNYSLARLNYNPLAKHDFTELFAGSFTAGANMLSSHDEWSETLASSNALSQDIFLTRTFPDNSNQPVSSKKISFPYPVRLGMIARSLDNGFLFDATAADGTNDIVLTKVDSAGMLPVCGSTDATATFTIEYNSGIAEIETPFPNQAILSALALNAANYNINAVTECRTLYCPTVPEPDTCLRTFFKGYRTSANSALMQRINVAHDTLLLQGRMRLVPYLALERPFISLMDTLGRQMESRVLNSQDVLDFSHTIKLKDGNFLSAGYVYYSYDSLDQFLIKYTSDFSIIWQKKLHSAEKYRNIAVILESAEGDFFCYIADKLSSTAEKRHLMKLSSTGDPIWFKSYTAGPNNFLGPGEMYAQMEEMGDHIYMKYHEETGDWSPHIIKIKKSDGSVAWVKKYEMPAVGTSFRPHALIARNNRIYMFGYGNMGQVFLKIAEDGTLVNSKVSRNVRSVAGVIKKDNDKFIHSTSVFQFNKTTYGLFEIDTSFNILRSQFVRLPVLGGTIDVVAYNDSVNYSVGNVFTQNPYWAWYTLQKNNFNSSFGSCQVTDFPFSLEDYPLNVLTKTSLVEPIALPQALATNGTFDPLVTGYTGFYCGNLPACTNIALAGPPTICDSSNIYTYSVTRNAGCTGVVSWTIDTTSGRIRIVNMTDTSIRIKAFASGTISISAKVFANCDWVSDTLMVDLSILPAVALNLGPDTVICPGNTIRLNARKGFASYRWQDGSTDSAYDVTAPGIYYVDVTSCNQTFRDSVIVSPHPPIPFYAGEDRTKCNNDTLHLQATPGFINYSWSPNYNINSTTAQTVVINPSVDTTYFIKAEKKPGCFAYDTVRVKVHRSPAIFLGNDTSFCFGESILLNAGNGFSTYAWNNGSTNSQLSVNAAGTYSVAATTAQGCRSADTLKVLNVFALPTVNLADIPSICTGTSVTFDAGNFSSYAWSTGSASRTITVNAPGTYYVDVTDNNNCSGSDTTRILSLLPLPTGFLPVDTFICSYGTLELKPLRPYQSYLWGNNATASAITISKPGTYYLQVTDNNNCTGKDTVNVSLKDCMQGFYIPNAFSPNNDRTNEVFRPMLFGTVKQYRFTIFNRWGNRVFESVQPGEGWNGTFNGKPQDSNTFLWTCSYQLEGEPAQLRRGTVILVR